MRYIHQHIETILSSYSGGLPLSYYLKNYFKVNPKLGSRDRKILSDMAYSYYRASKALNRDMEQGDKIKYSLYLSGINNKHIVPFLPELEMHANAADRIHALTKAGIAMNINNIFPYEYELSDGIEKGEWLLSMLSQPRLFIRVRKERKEIEKRLENNAIAYEYISDNCIALPNNTAIDKILPQDVYVVQDASSQKTGNYFHPSAGEKWLDCCSGAGGKSLLLKDIEPKVDLSVSDIRETILRNLKERFRMYGHAWPTIYHINVGDKSALNPFKNQKFDHIICDVPCSGSGTWARTPEQMYFFMEEVMDQLNETQHEIANNIQEFLKPGGRLLYITCSIFKKENEHIANNIDGVKLREMQLINGISINADSMYMAILEKES